jgi:hypothetical protein
MPVSTKPKSLLDAYRFAGVRPKARLRGVFGDPKARIITLTRRSKKRCVVVVAEPIVALCACCDVGFLEIPEPTAKPTAEAESSLKKTLPGVVCAQYRFDVSQTSGCGMWSFVRRLAGQIMNPARRAQEVHLNRHLCPSR